MNITRRVELLEEKTNSPRELLLVAEMWNDETEEFAIQRALAEKGISREQVGLIVIIQSFMERPACSDQLTSRP